MIRKQGGYTLIEMLVAISMSTLLTLAIGGFATNGVVGVNQDYNKTLVLSNAKEAVNVVARQVRLAKSVVSQNSLPDDNAPTVGDPYSWSGAAGTGSALILQVPAHDAGGNVIYKDVAFHTTVHTDEVIFYFNPTNRRLYKRVIKDTAAPGNVTRTTCPPSLATPGCPSDSTVVDDVATLTTSYLDTNGGTPSLPTNTQAVKYTVTETRTINGRAYTGTYSTIAALRNR